MSTPIFNYYDLELVSSKASRRQRWELMVTAPPRAAPGGTGSVNPIGTF